MGFKDMFNSKPTDKKDQKKDQVAPAKDTAKKVKATTADTPVIAKSQ
ncbi:hypothetical protein [Kordiimonas sp.]